MKTTYAGKCLILLLVLSLMISYFPVSIVRADDDDDAETVTVKVVRDVNYTSTDAILKRINEIRLEACKEGIEIGGKKLTESDYVPIKWSVDMEEIAMQRAAEASYLFSHTRPNGESWFSLDASSGQSSWCEIISGMDEAVKGVNHFYTEKEDLINNTGGQTGHYLALINPEYTYIGIGVYGTVVGELTTRAPSKSGRLAKNGERRTVDIEILKDDLNLRLRTKDGSDSVEAGGSVDLELLVGTLTIADQDKITWSSSSSAVAAVDKSGRVTGKAKGKATITALYRGVKKTIDINVIKGEWVKEGGNWKYKLSDGSYVTSKARLINGKWYCFDSNGNMLSGKWMFVPAEGNSWSPEVYISSDGSVARGWVKEDGTWYFYTAKNLDQLKNAYILSDRYLYNYGETLDCKTVLAIGWKKIGGKWYWFDSEGRMQTGWKKINSKWYYFGPDGDMKTGWTEVGGEWFHMTDNGDMQTGWQKLSGKWYYFNAAGVMLTGWNKIGGKWYYMNSAGIMLTGWQKIGSDWYYFESSGAMAAGKWVGDYYLLSNGRMAKNQWIGSYYVGPDGKWVKGKTK